MSPGHDRGPAALPPRGQWGRLLSLVDRAELLALARALAAGSRIEPTAPPEAGLVLVTLRDGVAGTPFHLGEMPATRVALRVETADGRVGEGGAIVAGEDLERAQAVALLDAVLAHDLPGAARVVELLARGQARAAAIERQRRTLLARTKVTFKAFGELARSPE